MPYFAVKHNGAALSCAGAADISVLSAAIGVMEDGASLHVHGMRDMGEGMREHMDWVTQILRPSDSVEIAYLLEAEPSLPRDVRRRVAPKSEAEILAALERIREEMNRHEEHFPVERQRSYAKAPRPHTLRVLLDNGPPVDALLGDEEALQAVIDFGPQGCVLNVDSLTVLDDGHTKGTRWLQKELVPGQRVQITYAA